MSLSTATITYDLSDYGLADFDYRRTKVWATNNVDGHAVIDTEGNTIHLGSANGTVEVDGTGEITVPTPGTGSNPASWQTTIHVDYPDRNAPKGRNTQHFGPYTITVDADLADLVTEMGTSPEQVGGDTYVAGLVTSSSAATRTALLGEFARPAGKTSSGSAARLPYLNPKDYGAKFDARTIDDGAITSGTNVFSTTRYNFSADDIGKAIKVVGAGVAGASLKTTITGASSGDALLGVNAATTVAGSLNQAPYEDGCAVFGTDDTAAIQACFNASVTYSTTTAATDVASVRTVRLPQGVALFTQLVIPRRSVIRGSGWGNYGTIYSHGSEQTNNTLLYQMWDVDDDAIIFTESSSGVFYAITDISDFSVQQDLDNTAGSGIAYRNAAGTALQWSDGNRAENIAVYGFAEHGWHLPGGMVPGHLVNCRGMVCGGAGLYMNMAPNGSISDIDNFSADGNGDGAIWLRGEGGTDTIGVVKIRSLKYECVANFYRLGAGRGEYAITLEMMGGASVDVDGCDVVAPSSETAAPSGAIQVIAGAQTPIVTFRAVRVRVHGAQTGTPVLLRDYSYAAGARPIANGVVEGCWTTGGTTRGTRIFGSSGGNLRDVMGWNEWLGIAGESPGHQLAGAQPVYSLFNLNAPADRQHAIFTMDTDGKVAIRTLTGAGTPRDLLALTPGATVADDRIQLGMPLTIDDRQSVIGSRMTVGRYFVQPYTGNGGAQSLTLNVVYYIPFPVARDCTLDRIGLYITTAAGASGVVRLGLYDDDGTGQPGARILDAGTVDSTVAATAREITINQAVTRGLYHIAVCGQVNVTGLTVPIGLRSNPLIGTTSLSSAVQAQARTHVQSGVTGALPSTATLADAGLGGGNRDVIVALRASA